MPAGLEHPLAAYAGFCAVKFAGYTAAAAVLNRWCPETPRNVFAVGAARTLIGMTFGAALFLSFAALTRFIGPAGYGLLLLIRPLEWFVLGNMFYGLHLRSKALPAVLVGGTVWSFVLDVPALFAGLKFIGHMWIC